MQRILDSHHHLWDYDPQQYPWVPVGSPLEQSYGLGDLAEHARGTALRGSIAVQARQTLEETDWLLSLAEKDPLCVGVVGWVPLRDESISEVFEQYADRPLLKGVRHVIQDEEDPEFMLRPGFLRGLEAMQDTDFTYDILIYGHQLPNTIRMVDRFPDQPFVLDHIAKPKIDPDKYDERWASGITQLAERPNVMCKVSGMATEVQSERWDVEVLRPYFDHVLASFGVGRLMFGSDWPVALLKTDYARWVSAVMELITPLSDDERDRVMYRNAAAFYRV